ncbi:MAG: FecR domain-containing protein [Planctomycetes bacterium]|nr:FecR domain-containing protein [Planctomycetota bacterium]
MDTTTPIAEQNTARLIEAACQPEPMASEFAAQVAARMLAQAKTLAPRQTTPRPERPWRRVALVVSGLAACALLLWAYAALRRLDPQIVNNPAKKSIDVDAPRPSAQFADWRNDDALVPRKRPEAPALATLKPGETLTTKPAQRRLVQLADGSRLYVNESTEVEATGPRQLTLHKGQIYVEVEPKGDGPRFVVKSGNRAITATGTHFAVSALDVVVTQGKVAISGVAEQIAAGQQIDLATSRIVPAPRASHTLAWTRELMAAAESPMVPGTQHGGGALIALDPNGQEIKLALRKYYIDVHIEDGFARTTIDQTYFNTTWERLEGTFYFPLPAAASLSRLAMYVVDGNQCKLMEGGMAERKHAADVYETIRYQRRDPALLEWLDGSTFKMRVFPLEAKQEKRIILSYTQKLSSLYGTSRYRFTGGLNMPVVREWSFHARIKNGSEMKVASPSTDHVQILPDAPDMVVKHFGENVKPEADVTIEMKETRPIDRDEPRFTSFLHEGQQYLMLRYRPTLKSEAKRERRDWIVLFETSAGRDPLVAGTQIDVLRHIMNNVEHDDTFTVLTVNSRVGEPSRVSGRVMDAASSGPLRGSARQLELLQQAHLVGALDLQQGLAAAVKLARDAKNPHLLHLGSGIPAMGERDAGKLAKLLPTSVRYVGVGVGKRWNRAFMKAAAERTNGLFTQINPDEPTKWRAFDLLATLNTPRLLDVQVVDAAGKAPFLMETTMIAQGEEVCALTRVDTAKSVAPGSVVVKGTLDGQAFTKEFPVLNVLAGGGYLPRTWAKLEIDRMLAAGSAKHKDAIIALSKAMYVMSPYTSLLVLETDADYERFKVDKGRKDHWAMYPAPAKIPLVYEPAGKPPVKVEVKKGAKPTCEEVLGTIVNALYIPDGGTVWFGGLAFIDPAAIEFDTDIQFNNKRIEDISVPGAVNPNEAIGILGGDITLRPFNIPAPRGFGSRGMGGALEKLPQLATWKALSKVRKEKYNPQREVLEGLDHLLRDGETLRATEQRLRKMREIDPDNVAVLAALHIAANKQAQAQHDRTTHANERVFLQLLDPNLGEYLDMQKPITFSRGTQTTDEWRRFWMNDQPSHLTPYRIHGGVGPASSALSGETINWTEYYRRHGYQINGTQNGAARIQFAPVFVSPQMQWAVPNGNGLISGLTYSGSLTPDLNIPIRNSSFNYSSANFLYQRPQLNYDRTFFTNLVQYAPGLQNTYADILATLEAEADVEQPKLGTIDADARKLIERARAAGWQSLTVPAEGPLAGYSIHYSGSGQFTYERMLVSGLREHVVCDGTTLWHLYPEIGLGAKRPFSRHHHALAASINPAFLPAPEELARGSM